MKMKLLAGALLALGLTSTVHAAGFVNGGFEDGNTNGWIIGGGSRGSQNLSVLNPSEYLPGGSRFAPPGSTDSAIMTPGTDAGSVGALLPNVVYSGGYSLRVQDTVNGGYVSVASQTVNNYTDANIFFAWLAVLQNGGHSAEQSAAMIIQLKDLTAGDIPISRVYNAVGTGGGVDSRFSQSGSFFYTSQWQIEQLAIDAARQGHNFELTVLASDCAPTGHEGYIYLDGFGSVAPPAGVPEPATALLCGAALLGMLGARRRKQA
jgi:hypothetical protein